MTESFFHEEEKNDNARAGILGHTLDRAIETFLDEGRSPSRKVNEIDDRGSHYWIARYWAEELASQEDDTELASGFETIAKDLAGNEEQILQELLDVQGEPADLGGYYWPDNEKTTKVMRPSETFNKIVDKTEDD